MYVQYVHTYMQHILAVCTYVCMTSVYPLYPPCCSWIIQAMKNELERKYPEENKVRMHACMWAHYTYPTYVHIVHAVHVSCTQVLTIL